MIVYDDIKFYRYPSSTKIDRKDYYRGCYKGKHIGLHVYLYTKYIGKILEGYHIDHINGNPLNNNLDNLQCLSPKEHHDKHHYKKLECSHPIVTRNCNSCKKEYTGRGNKYCSHKCAMKFINRKRKNITQIHGEN